jgi:hypothetical protein
MFEGPVVWLSLHASSGAGGLALLARAAMALLRHCRLGAGRGMANAEI